jgi:hypothetical protein
VVYGIQFPASSMDLSLDLLIQLVENYSIPLMYDHTPAAILVATTATLTMMDMGDTIISITSKAALDSVTSTVVSASITLAASITSTSAPL